ncbi:hypothetical protein [Prosthecodimorpha staleyi]|uniref:Uncharacterized protein n=1 Tax=Prosthecodimorpha staleyi TaxID=2840188 RepID=A0A947D5C4_9HYPH|nr:hypothetical protein [Prosthecodimorpha staleyi]MBT9288442.1 hypothetical protein [Prosthecodimorpha staleyi]
MGTVAQAVERLADAAEKLLFETERLRRDIMRLRQRIEPFDGERAIPEPIKVEFGKRWTAAEALDMIGAARKAIAGHEIDLGAIRSLMDTIEKDAYSREELKPWLKP